MPGKGRQRKQTSSQKWSKKGKNLGKIGGSHENKLPPKNGLKKGKNPGKIGGSHEKKIYKKWSKKGKNLGKIGGSQEKKSFIPKME